jgi:geranylgeranyl pyrophosphate synthase
MKLHYSKLEKHAQCKNLSAFVLSLPLDFQFVDAIFDFLKNSTKQGRWMCKDLQQNFIESSPLVLKLQDGIN